MRLLHLEEPVLMNIKKIRRLMGKYGLICPIRKPNPYRIALKASLEHRTAPYLVDRKFREFGPRTILLTDISYLFYEHNQVCYISVIIDAYTKQVLAHVVSPSLAEDFVLETVNQLIRNHKITLTTETIINSDQGVHYTCTQFIQILKDVKLRQSMSHKATCWDNAPQESFFGHMKDEINICECETFEEVSAIVDDWIDYYNSDRGQWALAKLTPNEYYEYCKTGVYPLSSATAADDAH